MHKDSMSVDGYNNSSGTFQMSRDSLIGVYEDPNVWSISTNGDLLVTSTTLSPINHPLDSRNPVLVRSGISLLGGVIGIACNSIALAAFRKTPKLRTKMFRLLFSLTVADLIIGLDVLLFYSPYQLYVYVFSARPCQNVILVAVFTAPQRYPIVVTMFHVGLISFERFIAVSFPLHYESWITDNTMTMIIAAGWILPAVLSSTFFLYVGRINWKTCTITASVLQALVFDIIYAWLIITVTIVLYSRVLMISLRQRARINAEMAAAQVATGSRTATEFSVPGKRLRAELKAVRLTACVVGVCIVLWSPYLIGRLIQVRGVNLLLGQYVADIGNSLIIFNSCINWIIYGLACGDFRRAVKKTLCSSRMGVTSVVPSTTTRLDDNRLGRL